MKTPLKLLQLQHLILLADELHFARAAERAFLSQSAFSRSIQALEESSGLRLFDRSLRHVKPTPAGERVIARARRLLSSATDLRRELDLLRSGDLGDVAVGAGPFSGLVLMPRVLAQLHQQHPDVRVRLDINDWATLLQHLTGEKLDFFMAEMRELPTSDEWWVEPLGVLTGGLYCRAGHPLAGRQSIGAGRLRGARFASVHMPEMLNRTLTMLLASDAKDVLPIALECESPQILRDFVACTDVIMLAPAQAVEAELRAGILTELTVREIVEMGAKTPLRTELGLVRQRDRTPTPASEILMSLLCEHAKATLLPCGGNQKNK